MAGRGVDRGLIGAGRIEARQLGDLRARAWWCHQHDAIDTMLRTGSLPPPARHKTQLLQRMGDHNALALVTRQRTDLTMEGAAPAIGTRNVAVGQLRILHVGAGVDEPSRQPALPVIRARILAQP